MSRTFTKYPTAYVKASMTTPVSPKDLSKERLELITTSVVDILKDSEIGTSNQLLKILKVCEYYNLV